MTTEALRPRHNAKWWRDWLRATTGLRLSRMSFIEMLEDWEALAVDPREALREAFVAGWDERGRHGMMTDPRGGRLIALARYPEPPQPAPEPKEGP